MQPSFWLGFLCKPLLAPPGVTISKAFTVSAALGPGDTIPPSTGPAKQGHDRLLSWPPGTSSTGWSWFEALHHSSWLTGSLSQGTVQGLVAPSGRFWAGMSPSTAGWDQALFCTGTSLAPSTAGWDQALFCTGTSPAPSPVACRVLPWGP